MMLRARRQYSSTKFGLRTSQKSVVGARRLDIQRELFMLSQFQGFLESQQRGPINNDFLRNYQTHAHMVNRFLARRQQPDHELSDELDLHLKVGA